MKLVSIPLAEAEKVILDTGIVYAINRLILHPLGLAMAFSGEHIEEMTSLQIMRTDDGEPLTFDPEFEEVARQKLIAWLKHSEHIGRPPLNQDLFNRLLNTRRMDESFEANYLPTEFRHLMGVDKVSPLLVRDHSTPYVTYAPYTRRNLSAALGGDISRRPGLILTMLDRAWKVDHPHDDDVPKIVMLPDWFAVVWDQMTAQFHPDQTFVGRVYGSHNQDRIFLTHGPS